MGRAGLLSKSAHTIVLMLLHGMRYNLSSARLFLTALGWRLHLMISRTSRLKSNRPLHLHPKKEGHITYVSNKLDSSEIHHEPCNSDA